MRKISPDFETLRLGLKGLCPRCRQHSIFKPGFSLDLVQSCPGCGLDLSRSDSADGPAVFLIFILGFSLVPLALWLDHVWTFPLWAHAVLWTVVALGLTIGALRPLKAYIIALQFKHRPNDWTG